MIMMHRTFVRDRISLVFCASWLLHFYLFSVFGPELLSLCVLVKLYQTPCYACAKLFMLAYLCVGDVLFFIYILQYYLALLRWFLLYFSCASHSLRWLSLLLVSDE